MPDRLVCDTVWHFIWSFFRARLLRQLAMPERSDLFQCRKRLHMHLRPGVHRGQLPNRFRSLIAIKNLHFLSGSYFFCICPVAKVSRILPDLRSGAQKFYHREIRGPIDINKAPGDINRIFQGP